MGEQKKLHIQTPAGWGWGGGGGGGGTVVKKRDANTIIIIIIKIAAVHVISKLVVQRTRSAWSPAVVIIDLRLV